MTFLCLVCANPVVGVKEEQTSERRLGSGTCGVCKTQYRVLIETVTPTTLTAQEVKDRRNDRSKC